MKRPTTRGVMLRAPAALVATTLLCHAQINVQTERSGSLDRDDKIVVSVTWTGAGVVTTNALATALATKADLVGGKVPLTQLPTIPGTDTLMDVTMRGDKADSMKIKRGDSETIVGGKIILSQGKESWELPWQWGRSFGYALFGPYLAAQWIGYGRKEVTSFYSVLDNPHAPDNKWLYLAADNTGVYMWQLEQKGIMPGTEGTVGFSRFWEFSNDEWKILDPALWMHFNVNAANVVALPLPQYAPVAAIGDPVLLQDAPLGAAWTLSASNGIFTATFAGTENTPPKSIEFATADDVAHAITGFLNNGVLP